MPINFPHDTVLLKPPPGVQLDEDWEFYGNILGCWLLNEWGGTTIRDLSRYYNTGTAANGFQAPPVSGVGWVPPTSNCTAGAIPPLIPQCTPYVIVTTGPNNGYVDCGSLVKQPSTGLTFAMWAFTKDVTQTNQYVGGKNDGNDTSGSFGMALNGGGSPGIKPFISTSSGGGAANNMAYTFVNVTWYHLCMTWDGVNVVGYVNGIKQGSFAKAGTMGSLVAPFRLGMLGSDTTLTIKGGYSAALVLDCPLPAAEIYDLANDRPWKFLSTGPNYSTIWNPAASVSQGTANVWLLRA